MRLGLELEWASKEFGNSAIRFYEPETEPITEHRIEAKKNNPITENRINDIFS